MILGVYCASKDSASCELRSRREWVLYTIVFHPTRTIPDFQGYRSKLAGFQGSYRRLPLVTACVWKTYVYRLFFAWMILIVASTLMSIQW